METSNARKTRPRPPQIDHDKLRSAICRLNHDTVGHMLDDAIELVFFANEGGSWQVGVDWQNVLPAWFKCIPGTVEPHVYAQRVIAIVDGFAKHDRDKFLAVAGRTASSAQRKALAESTSRKRVRGS